MFVDQRPYCTPSSFGQPHTACTSSIDSLSGGAVARPHACGATTCLTAIDALSEAEGHAASKPPHLLRRRRAAVHQLLERSGQRGVVVLLAARLPTVEPAQHPVQLRRRVQPCAAMQRPAQRQEACARAPCSNPAVWQSTQQTRRWTTAATAERWHAAVTKRGSGTREPVCSPHCTGVHPAASTPAAAAAMSSDALGRVSCARSTCRLSPFVLPSSAAGRQTFDHFQSPQWTFLHVSSARTIC